MMSAQEEAGVADEPSRKRARVVGDKETVDGDDKSDTPQPFTSLPFYGDHKRAVSSLSFAPPQSSSSLVLCATACADGSARIWDITKNIQDVQNVTAAIDAMDTGSPKQPSKKGATTPPPPPSYHPSSSTFPATAHRRIDPKLNLFGHSRGINDITWSPTGSYLATASDDKTLRLWSAETGDAFVEFRGHTNFVFSCRFNPQSNLLVSGVSNMIGFICGR